ncbi:MAG: OsmC family protein [Gemmatimonadales bacterium]
MASAVSARWDAGTKVSITNGLHTWSSDEPLDAGGSDTGPNPYELLLGSLAACTCITLGLYCRHKGIELRSVRVDLTQNKIHADDCADCDDEMKGFIDRISSAVLIDADVHGAQRTRLGQVATRCPVHKTLGNRVTFEDTVAFVGADAG